MGSHNRILIAAVLLLMCFVCYGCIKSNIMKNSSDTKFPTEKKGYPKKDVVLINGKEYSLADIQKSFGESGIINQIELQMDSTETQITVVLPRIQPTLLWSMEEQENIDLISYKEEKYTVHGEMRDGESAEIQIFVFKINRDSDQRIRFKWSNVNEQGKSFQEKEGVYTLELFVQ